MAGRRTGIVMITSTSIAVLMLFMILGPRLHSAAIHDSDAAAEASADRTSVRSRQKQQLQPATGPPPLTLRSGPKGDQRLSDISSSWWNITKTESSDENKRELQSLGSSSGACGYHGFTFTYYAWAVQCPGYNKWSASQIRRLIKLHELREATFTSEINVETAREPRFVVVSSYAQSKENAGVIRLLAMSAFGACNGIALSISTRRNCRIAPLTPGLLMTTTVPKATSLWRSAAGRHAALRMVRERERGVHTFFVVPGITWCVNFPG